MSSARLTTALLMCIAFPTTNAHAESTCNLKLSGSEFLAAASERGIEPVEEEACYRVSLSDNAFYALPDSRCVLRFDNTSWLVEGARFHKVRGHGKFSTTVSQDGLAIKIKKEGGFFMDSVVIQVTGGTIACKLMGVDNVLKGG